MVFIKTCRVIGVVVALVACKRTEPQVELHYDRCRWEGDGPDAIAHCQFHFLIRSGSPVFVEAGSSGGMLAWQRFDGDRWDFVDDVMFHTEVFMSKPQKITESEPLILESTLLRRQIERNPRLRVGIRYSMQDDLREGKVVFTDEFTLGGK